MEYFCEFSNHVARQPSPEYRTLLRRPSSSNFCLYACFFLLNKAVSVKTPLILSAQAQEERCFYTFHSLRSLTSKFWNVFENLWTSSQTSSPVTYHTRSQFVRHRILLEIWSFCSPIMLHQIEFVFSETTTARRGKMRSAQKNKYFRGMKHLPSFEVIKEMLFTCFYLAKTTMRTTTKHKEDFISYKVLKQ